MFIIFGFGPRKCGVKEVASKSAVPCTIFYIANCFSLFFIPVLFFSKRFFISYGEAEKEISKEQYKEMKKTGVVLRDFEEQFDGSYTDTGYSNGGTDENSASYVGGVCPVCKKELTTDFAYCPYCGQKRPKR